MKYLPPALYDLIEALGTLPGVGSRTAERYAYYLLKTDPASSQKLASTVTKLHDSVDYCVKTFALIPKGEEISELYSHPDRDRSVVAVVAEPFDIIALEKIGLYKGTYHVLGGLISPIDNIHPEQLRLRELIERVEDDDVKEIIIATNASVEGESTALYIQQQLQGQEVRITRLARGLPVGVDLEYADQITLGRALEGRTLL